MSSIVKLSVVWQQRFDDEGIWGIVWLNQLSFIGSEQGVVFTDTAVIVLFIPVNANAAKNNGNAIRGSNDVLGTFFAVL